MKPPLCAIICVGFVSIVGLAPAHAQDRVDENAVKQAEDAFGLSLGRESIGLYSASNVRGFSPTSAGNARIEGLYFDQVWGITARLREATNIRVGLSAFGFPFPAPTGVIDYQMKRPGEESESSAYAALTSDLGVTAEYDAVVPLSNRNMSLGLGAALYANEFSNGTNSLQHILGAQALWQPNSSIEIQPFFARSDIYDDEIGPVFVPAGDTLPPKIERRQFLGPDWSEYEGSAINYGAL
jgi:iron complex outermembrane recepter protein